ncbi:MAG: BlaI/MecI/CopY family transcriptional regulator, partial [Cyclobacteriaceae bacterium]
KFLISHNILLFRILEANIKYYTVYISYITEFSVVKLKNTLYFSGMEKLTKAEEPVMQIIWRLKSAFVKEIISEMSVPKPPYNTVSSIVRGLESKGFLGHKAFGKTHQYYPVITKGAYRKYVFTSMLSDYFDGSLSQVVSNFVEEKSLEPDEIDSLRKIIDQAKHNDHEN